MVYITSDLFGAASTNDCSGSSIPTQTHSWNVMVESQLAAGLGKRKRRIDDSNEGPSLTHHNSQHRSSPSSRGVIRVHGHCPSHDANSSRIYPISVTASTYFTPERRPVKQLKRINPKPTLVKSTSHLMDIEPDPAPSHSNMDNTDRHTTSDLRPCHACKTAPKRRRDLENYMECKRCDERTCYICARECLRCQKAICKKCTVEVGEEGDPWCLECYARDINT